MLLLLGPFGCFGEWVSARTRPHRETLPEATKPDSEPTPGMAPAERCPAYLDAVALLCTEVLRGSPHSPGCHAQIVRVMALDDANDAIPKHERCRKHLQAMPETNGSVADTGTDDSEAVKLGPHCRAWGTAIHERCVTPLRDPKPDLNACPADLAAFEGTLSSIAFGRAEEFEPSCRDAAERLAGLE